jgi:hypothetical protein
MSLSFIDDPFCVARMFALQAVEQLLLDEAWTPERKAEIVQRMSDDKKELVEHTVIGDYDLTLWHYTVSGWYVVGLNSGQEDPTTMLGQERKPKSSYLAWNKVVSILRQWVLVHGKIIVGSSHPEKTEAYRRLLTRYFLVAEWSEHPGAGFFLLPD